MKKLFLAPLLALSLGGCMDMLGAAAGALMSGGSAPTPQAVADRTVLDEKAGIAVETLYSALARAGALAFRTGVIEPSANPAVQSDGFCALVRAGEFEPTDRGSHLMALECRLRRARDLTRQAYDAGNAASYDQAAREAVALGREMLALIRGD